MLSLSPHGDRDPHQAQGQETHKRQRRRDLTAVELHAGPCGTQVGPGAQKVGCENSRVAFGWGNAKLVNTSAERRTLQEVFDSSRCAVPTDGGPN